MRKTNLKQKLYFVSDDKYDLRSVEIFPCRFSDNFRWVDYALFVRDYDGLGELSFNEYKAIVNSKYFDNDGSYGVMSVKNFKQRFYGIIQELVPKEVYFKYLNALDMGVEGIFPEADDKQALFEFSGLKDFRLSYLLKGL